jgi:hypothetical protein
VPQDSGAPDPGPGGAQGELAIPQRPPWRRAGDVVVLAPEQTPRRCQHRFERFGSCLITAQGVPAYYEAPEEEEDRERHSRHAAAAPASGSRRRRLVRGRQEASTDGVQPATQLATMTALCLPAFAGQKQKNGGLLI